MADTLLARAIIEVGAKGITDTQAQIAGLEKKLGTLKAGYAAGTVSLKDYLSQSQQLQGQISQLTSGLTAAEAAIKKHGSAVAASAAMAAQAMATAQKASQGGMGGAMGLMVLSQALDDVQYGFRAIVNNIPMMGMAMGSVLGMSTEMATKFGAIAGIAAVAINFIINHWDQLFQRFGYGTDTMKQVWISVWGETKDVTIDALDAIEARIKELEAKPIKMAVDIHEIETAKEELEELKAGRKAWEAMGKGKSPFEKESGEKVKGLFGEMDSKALESLQNDLVNKRAGDMNAGAAAGKDLTPEELAAAKKKGGMTAALAGPFAPMVMKGAVDAAVKAAREAKTAEFGRVKEANKGKASDELGVMMDKVGKGDAVAQEKLAKALEAIGRHGLAAQVRSLSPEAAAEAHAAGGADKAAAEKVAAERQKGIDLTQQGAENEHEMRERNRAQAARYANAIAPQMTREMTKPGGISDKDLTAKVKDALLKAGVAVSEIPIVLGDTVKKLKEGLRERVDEKMMGGLTREQATAAVAQEDLQKQRGLGKPQAEVMSTENYLNKLLVAGGGPPKDNRDLSEAQLKQQTEMAAILAEINATLANMKPGPAVFGGKGGK